MHWLELLSAGVAGLIASSGILWLLLRNPAHRHAAQRTAERHHTHSVPVPRLGGLGLAGALVAVIIIFGSCGGAAFFVENDRWVVAAGALAMFGLGLWDDLRGLGARRKLLGQILIASVVYAGGVGIFHFRIPFWDVIVDLHGWAWLVTVFWLVAMTNLINLIDGVDGLAGGICLMLLTLLLYVSGHTGPTPILTAAMVGGLIGFLRYNFPPARIYLGDGGAYFLGFYIGCSTIVTSQKGTIFAALVAPLFVLALPIIDTTLAILRRGLRGLPLFRPDRKHIHHRLLDSGHSRRTVVLGLYAFTAIFLLLGFAAFSFHRQFIPLFVGVGGLTILIAAGKFDFSREWFSIGRVVGNSLETRAEVQYAMSLTHWLAQEGKRAQSLAELARDVVFIARKLNFTAVRIRLEDDEQHWTITPAEAAHCQPFRHGLPGHKYCFLELEAACKIPHQKNGRPSNNDTTFAILADLVAEGWVKAVTDWRKIHRAPPRFDERPIK